MWGPLQKQPGKTQTRLHRYDAIKALINNPHGELVLLGALAPSFEYLMPKPAAGFGFLGGTWDESLGRDRRGEVVSLVGRLVETLGFSGFFHFLSEICGGAVLDTRVFFEHFHWELTQADRFASDVGALELITHPGLQEFTRAAFSANIPVLLGGHSLVSGGMWALIDASSREQTLLRSLQTGTACSTIKTLDKAVPRWRNESAPISQEEVRS